MENLNLLGKIMIKKYIVNKLLKLWSIFKASLFMGYFENFHLTPTIITFPSLYTNRDHKTRKTVKMIKTVNWPTLWTSV